MPSTRAGAMTFAAAGTEGSVAGRAWAPGTTTAEVRAATARAVRILLRDVNIESSSGLRLACGGGAVRVEEATERPARRHREDHPCWDRSPPLNRDRGQPVSW